MIKRFILFLILIAVFSCGREINEMKFDVQKWNDESDRGYYNNRNAMLNDLMNNYHLKGKSVEEITNLFHFFDSANNIISMEVYQEWKGIDPVYTKFLNLNLNKNKIVDSVYITEYRR
jgi:hypothetical protein